MNEIESLKVQLKEEIQRREQTEQKLYRHIESLASEIEKSDAGLLSALAAIEKHNKECPDECYEIVL